MIAISPDQHYGIDIRSKSVGTATFFEYVVRNALNEELCAAKASYVSADLSDLQWTLNQVQAATVSWASQGTVVSLSEIQHNYSGTVIVFSLDSQFSNQLTLPISQLLNATNQCWDEYAINAFNGWTPSGYLQVTVDGRYILSAPEYPDFPYEYASFCFQIKPSPAEGILRMAGCYG